MRFITLNKTCRQYLSTCTLLTSNKLNVDCPPSTTILRSSYAQINKLSLLAAISSVTNEFFNSSRTSFPKNYKFGIMKKQRRLELSTSKNIILIKFSNTPFVSKILPLSSVAQKSLKNKNKLRHTGVKTQSIAALSQQGTKLTHPIKRKVFDKSIAEK